MLRIHLCHTAQAIRAIRRNHHVESEECILFPTEQREQFQRSIPTFQVPSSHLLPKLTSILIDQPQLWVIQRSTRDIRDDPSLLHLPSTSSENSSHPNRNPLVYTQSPAHPAYSTNPVETSWCRSIYVCVPRWLWKDSLRHPKVGTREERKITYSYSANERWGIECDYWSRW